MSCRPAGILYDRPESGTSLYSTTSDVTSITASELILNSSPWGTVVNCDGGLILTALASEPVVFNANNVSIGNGGAAVTLNGDVNIVGNLKVNGTPVTVP